MKGYYDMCSDIELLDEKIAIYYVQNKSLPITSETKNIQELIDAMEDKRLENICDFLKKDSNAQNN